MKKFLLFFVLIVLIIGFSFSEDQFKVSKKDSFFYAYMEITGSYQQMPQKITDFIQTFFKQGLTPTGTLLTAYYNSPEKVKESELIWRVGFPVAEGVMVKKPLKKDAYQKKKVLVYLHKGSYQGLPKVYDKIQAFLQEKGLDYILPTYEFYLNDPSKVKPEELLTRIEIPIKKK